MPADRAYNFALDSTHAMTVRLLLFAEDLERPRLELVLDRLVDKAGRLDNSTDYPPEDGDYDNDSGCANRLNANHRCAALLLAMFGDITSDPAFDQVRMIAEPWNASQGDAGLYARVNAGRDPALFVVQDSHQRRRRVIDRVRAAPDDIALSEPGPLAHPTYRVEPRSRVVLEAARPETR